MKKKFNYILVLCFVFSMILRISAQQTDSKASEKIQNAIENLKSENEIKRFEAEKSLIEIGKSTVAPLNEIINKETGYSKVYAAKTVLGIEPDNQTTLNTLLIITKNKNEKLEVRRYAAYVLALSPSGVPLLDEMNQDADVFVRRSAAFALNELFDISGVLSVSYKPVLTKAIATEVAALGDSDDVVSGLATETLIMLRGDIDFLFDATAKSPNQKLREVAQQVKEARKRNNSTYGQQMKMDMKTGAEDEMKKNKNLLPGKLGIIYALSIGGEPVQDYRSIPQSGKLNLSLRITINPQSRRASTGLSQFNPYQELN